MPFFIWFFVYEGDLCWSLRPRGLEMLPTRSTSLALGRLELGSSPSERPLRYEAFESGDPPSDASCSTVLSLKFDECCAPPWTLLTAEFCRITSSDRPLYPLYLFFGKRSVNENRFLEILIVLSSAALSASFLSISSGLSESGKNFFDNDSTMGRARTCSQEGR